MVLKTEELRLSLCENMNVVYVYEYECCVRERDTVFCVLCLVTQSCPTLCNPMDCSPPGSSLSMGIIQARILEWVAISSFKGSSQPRDGTQVSRIAGGFFTV